MSNQALTAEETFNQHCVRPAGCKAVELLIEPRDTDLGGFSVRRVLPTRQRRMVGPWIFFDHMGRPPPSRCMRTRFMSRRTCERVNGSEYPMLKSVQSTWSRVR